jgi:hypothetical protein
MTAMTVPMSMPIVIVPFFLLSFGALAFEATPAGCSDQGDDAELTSLLQDRYRVEKPDADRLESANSSTDFVREGWRFARSLLDRAMHNPGITLAHAHTHSALDLDRAMEPSEGKATPVGILAGISATDFVLACCAIGVITSEWRSTSSVQTTGFLGLTTSTQAGLVLGFLSFSVAHVFIVQRAGSTGYSTISATILVYIAKSTVSSLMFLFRADVKTGLQSFLAPGCTRFGKTPAFIVPMIPGGFLAVADVLTFLILTHVDPVTYLIFMNMRTVFVGFSWEFMFRRKLSATQWLALLLFMVASITKGVDRAHAMSAGGFQVGISLAIVKALMGALGSTSSEMLLKDMAMPTDLVNACTYFWGFVCMVIVMLCSGGASGLYSDMLSATAWSKLQADPWMIGSICCLTVFGIISAYLLKHRSNIFKESAQAIVIVLSTVLQWLLVGSSAITPMGIMGVSMAVLGVKVYSTDPLHNRAKEVESHPVADPQTCK